MCVNVARPAKDSLDHCAFIGIWVGVCRGIIVEVPSILLHFLLSFLFGFYLETIEKALLPILYVCLSVCLFVGVCHFCGHDHVRMNWILTVGVHLDLFFYFWLYFTKSFCDYATVVSEYLYNKVGIGIIL